MLWYKSSHSKRRCKRPSVYKYFHDLVMGLVRSVAVKLVGDFIREILPILIIGKCWFVEKGSIHGPEIGITRLFLPQEPALLES